MSSLAAKSYDDTPFKEVFSTGPDPEPKETVGALAFQHGQGPLTEACKARTRRILLKIDVRVLPVAAVLYFFSFLDRAAIGNAKVAGMNADLGLTSPQYILAVCLFFVTYALFEVPSNMVMRIIGAKRWLPFTAIPWGLCMLLTGVTQNLGGLVVCRMLLGVFEAGILPGLVATLSFVYPASALQARISIFFAAANLGGAFGGLLAYALSHIHSASYPGWRWIFIIEGALTILISVPTYFFLVSSLDDAHFLSAEEKTYMRDRILFDGNRGGMTEGATGKRKGLVAGLTDWKVWLMSLVFFMGAVPVYCLALTLPTILNNGFGYDRVKSQLMTVPVYLTATLGVVLTGFLADRYSARGLPLLFLSALGLAGWLIGLATPDPHARYAGCFLAATGAFCATPCALTLLAQNLANETKRCTGIAAQISVSAAAAVLASNIFPPEDAPRFKRAHWVCVGCILGIWPVTITYLLAIRRENRRKEERLARGEYDGYSKEALFAMGDASPHFRYRF